MECDLWDEQGLSRDAFFEEVPPQYVGCGFRPIGVYAPPGDWKVCGRCLKAHPREVLFVRATFIGLPLFHCESCNTQDVIGIALNDAVPGGVVTIQIGAGRTFEEFDRLLVNDVNRIVTRIDRESGTLTLTSLEMPSHLSPTLVDLSPGLIETRPSPPLPNNGRVPRGLQQKRLDGRRSKSV